MTDNPISQEAARAMPAALREILAHIDNSGRGNPIVDDRIIDRIEETALAADYNAWVESER